MDEAPIDLRRVRDIAQSGFVNNFLVDPARQFGFFAAFHPRLKVLFGYIFSAPELSLAQHLGSE